MTRARRTVLKGVAAVGVLLSAGRGSTPASAPVEVSRQIYLMGTIATLVTYAETRPQGLAQLERMVQVLEHTEAELSTWRPDSALSRVNRAAVGQIEKLPPSLCRLIGQLALWHRATEGAFDPAIGALLEAWGIGRGGRHPTPRELAEARERSGFDLLGFDATRCTLRRRADVLLDAGAFGKGEALDRVARALRGARSPRFGALVDLGGQIMVYGPPPGGTAWSVGLADPTARTTLVAVLPLERGSLATSGGSERDMTVEGVRIGHILDPRTGRPVNGPWSATVWHERALVADILSTALYVLGPEAGLAWAERYDVAACFLVPQRAGDAGRLELRPSRSFLARFPELHRFWNSPHRNICCP